MPVLENDLQSEMGLEAQRLGISSFPRKCTLCGIDFQISGSKKYNGRCADCRNKPWVTEPGDYQLGTSSVRVEVSCNGRLIAKRENILTTAFEYEKGLVYQLDRKSVV